MRGSGGRSAAGTLLVGRAKSVSQNAANVRSLGDFGSFGVALKHNLRIRILEMIVGGAVDRQPRRAPIAGYATPTSTLGSVCCCPAGGVSAVNPVKERKI
jgi:hypothetical protein